MLLYVVCTAGEFVWNEGNVVPATCYLRLISRCVIFKISFIITIILGREKWVIGLGLRVMVVGRGSWVIG